MGVDMLLYVLWTNDGKVTADKAKRDIREALMTETDKELLNAVRNFMGYSELEDLAMEVMMATPGSREAWVEETGTHYDKMIDNLVNSLNSREVTTIILGPLVGFATGGPSWGDDPTECMGMWNQLLFDDDWDYGNPYAGLLYASLGFVEWNASIAKPGQPFADVKVTEATEERIQRAREALARA